MANSQEDDLEVLSNSLFDLLSGELKVGMGLLKVGASLKREGKNKEWVTKGLQRWMAENEEALPLLAAALGEEGVQRLKAWLEAKKPA